MKRIVCQGCHKEFESKRISRKWCDECKKAQQRESNHKWYYGHHNEVLAYHRNWADTHEEYKQQKVENHKRWRENNPERWQEHQAKNFQRHKENRVATNKQWIKDHPEEHKQGRIMRDHRRRARLLQAGGTWTPKQFAELCEASDDHCWYCQKQCDNLTVEHMQPLSRGGSNDIANIAPVCPSCNYTKRDKTVLEFMTRKMYA